MHKYGFGFVVGFVAAIAFGRWANNQPEVDIKEVWSEYKRDMSVIWDDFKCEINNVNNLD